MFKGRNYSLSCYPPNIISNAGNDIFKCIIVSPNESVNVQECIISKQLVLNQNSGIIYNVKNANMNLRSKMTMAC